ncbi:MAG: ATP-binding cassette domain-containing protein [Candidatus Nitrotoga sp.]
MDALALELLSIGKTFNPGQWNEVVAVRDVSMNFEWGESVLIVGENGSGKSTLLNLVDGMIELTSGRVQMSGTDVSSWQLHRRYKYIHRVHQDPSQGLAPFGTIAENLAVLGLKNASLFNFSSLIGKGDMAHFEQAIAEVKPDLAMNLLRKVYLLSPGQRQSVALVMLALSDGARRILLADEPTAALDPHTAETCLTLINRKAADGWLVLHVTHNPAIIASHRGRLITMHEGKVASDVTT